MHHRRLPETYRRAAAKQERFPIGLVGTINGVVELGMRYGPATASRFFTGDTAESVFCPTLRRFSADSESKSSTQSVFIMQIIRDSTRLCRQQLETLQIKSASGYIRNISAYSVAYVS